MSLKAHTREDIEVLATLVWEDVERHFYGEPMPTFTFSRRDTWRRLGTTWPWDNRITIYWYPMRYWSVDAVEDLIRHELAHVLAFQTYSDAGHGSGWRDTCATLGALPQADSDEGERSLFAASNRVEGEGS